MDKPELEYKKELTLNHKVTIELNVMSWVQVGEFLQYALGSLRNNGITSVAHGVTLLSNAVADALMTPASIKAYDAAYNEMMENANPLMQFMKAAGITPADLVFGEDDE